MHEASLVQGILGLVKAAVEDHNGKCPERTVNRVREIVCQYGILACFEEQTLKACFEMFAEGSCAENAVLTLKPEPLSCQCTACGASFVTSTRAFICPECGSNEVSFSGGHGLVVEEIIVATGDQTDDRTNSHQT